MLDAATVPGQCVARMISLSWLSPLCACVIVLARPETTVL